MSRLKSIAASRDKTLFDERQAELEAASAAAEEDMAVEVAEVEADQDLGSE